MRADEIERLNRFEETYWWHRAKSTIARRVLRRYVRPGGRVLDVGCGTGATAQMFTEFGEVFGADLMRGAAAHVHGRGIAACQSAMPQLALRDEAFDVAVALDVLEHVEDDAAGAAELFRVLRPGGLLLVTVPAYQFLWSRHDEALNHYRRYLRGGVGRLLLGAGFELPLCSYVMSTILPAAMAVRLAERILPQRSDEPHSGYIELPRVINSALAHIVGLGGLLVGRLPIPFGLSVLAVARRPAEAEASSVHAARSGTGTAEL